VNQHQPRILTKHVHLTSYEHHTVVLPCEVINLPNDMHIIWQFGKRGSLQTVLSIGRTQIENNYRLRVITNSTNDQDTEITFNYFHRSSFKSHQQLTATATSPPLENLKITSNNLEIRKLQIADSGFYECQLPTKPTQINYVFLEVLANPRIEQSTATLKQHLKPGDQLDLTCHVKHLPARFDIYWTFNDKRIVNAQFINKTLTNTNSTSSSPPSKHRQQPSSQLSSIIIQNDKINNMTISKLRITSLNEQTHKGVYRCKYDKLEAKYTLDFSKSNTKDTIQKIKQQILNKNEKDFDSSNSFMPSSAVVVKWWWLWPYFIICINLK